MIPHETNLWWEKKTWTFNSLWSRSSLQKTHITCVREHFSGSEKERSSHRDGTRRLLVLCAQGVQMSGKLRASFVILLHY